jgi:hypothetical protein
MSDKQSTLWEQLRQAAWQGLILRDRLLEIAEDLPSPDRERIRQTAAKMVTFGARLSEIAEKLPKDPDVDLLEALDDPDEVRESIESALEDYFEAALDELQAYVDEVEGETEGDSKPPK